MTASIADAGNLQLAHSGARGVVTAEIDLVGAALDALSVGGIELIQQWDRSQIRPYSSGLVLAPWPNRIRDGKWSDGESHFALDISEPLRNNAIHGLVAEKVFRLAESSESSAKLTAEISSVSGYPFSLELSVTYSLSERGITCEMTLKNTGKTAAPVALGAHPYITVGDAPIRSLSIEAPVVSHLITDTQMIPVAEEAIEGSDVDISSRVSLKNLDLDTGFRLGGEAPYTTTLAAPDGKRVSLWQSTELGWLQVFVTDEFPGPDGPTSAVAVEPMTAPANAFNSGTNLKWLEPGESWGGRWGISLSY